MSFCPSCGCGLLFHREVVQIGDERIAHCDSCGPCWKTSNTPFIQEVAQRLAKN